jgi:hypothetical protein
VAALVAIISNEGMSMRLEESEFGGSQVAGFVLLRVTDAMNMYAL